MTLHAYPVVRGVVLEHADSMVVDPASHPSEQPDDGTGRSRPGARRAVDALRTAGLHIGAVAERPVSDRRVEALVGPLDAWVATTAGGVAADESTVRDAATALGVDPSELVVIGDAGTEMRAAHAVGAAGILVPSGRIRDDGLEDADVVVPSLVDAVALVLHSARGTHRH